MTLTLLIDAVGRITGKTETVGGVTTQYDYGYDDSNRLAYVKENGVITQRWDYDENGNRTHEGGGLVAGYDAQDRLTSNKDNEYRYTANGELTEKTDTATSETTQFEYDAFSNLRSVTLSDGTEIECIIDGQNRRVGKLRNGTLEQGFLYQGQLNPVAELEGNNNLVARFVYGDKGHVPAYMIKDGTNYRIVSDHLGSVRLVVNASTGEVKQRIDYDAWGNVTNDTNPGFQPFGYAGGIYDRDTGLVRFGARDYDPEVGRWTTKDLIGFNGGLNHYAYANSSPVIYIDPTGNIGLLGAAYGGIAGGVGGFISGGWQGAVAGAGAGALIGTVNVFGASAAGAAAGAGVASILGQAAGNVVSGKDFTAFCNYDLSAAAGAALGGAIGGPLGQAVGKYFPLIRYPIVGRPLSSNGFNQVPGNSVGAVIEGASVGVGELGGQRL